MAEFYRFFDSTIDDIREYNADEYAEYFRVALTNGIYNGGTNLQVNAGGGNMTVDVLDGFALINGYLYKVADGVSLSIETAHNTYDRIDRIVIRWDKREESRFIKATVIKGVEAENPVAPAITREGDVYDLAIAQVFVQAGKSYISGSNVTDERLNTEVCGLINSQIQADTTEIFNQYQAWYIEKSTEFEANKTDLENQFQAWYNAKTVAFETAWNNWFSQQMTEGFLMASEKGVAGGVAGLNAQGKVVDATGSEVTGAILDSPTMPEGIEEGRLWLDTGSEEPFEETIFDGMQTAIDNVVANQRFSDGAKTYDYSFKLNANKDGLVFVYKEAI